MTMELTKVAVNNRTESGKGAASRLRHQGKIPAVAYGRGESPLPVAVSPDVLKTVLLSEHGRNTVLELELDGGIKFPVLVREYQVHPLTRSLLHVDFIRISLEEPVDVEVPFETVGKAPGIIKGGTLHVVFRRLPIRCLPQDIPTNLTADISELDIDGHISVSALPVPAGVSIRLLENQTLVAIVTESSSADEAAATTGAEAATGVPAAGAAAAAPAAAAGDKGGTAAKPGAAAPAAKAGAAKPAAAKPAAGGKAPAKGK
jgi:large subunit ribosomal protein L25